MNRAATDMTWWWTRTPAAAGDRGLEDPRRRVAVPAGRGRRVIAALGSALFVISAVFALARDHIAIWQARNSLNASIPAPRPVEGRLSSGFRSSAFVVRSDHRGAHSMSAGLEARALPLLMAAERVRAACVNRSNPTCTGLLGVTSLLLGDPDRAADLLATASTSAPDDARFKNDLSAALVERARLHSRPRDLARAFESAAEALRHDPSMHEARFNQALSLQLLGLHEEATVAWRQYLEVDTQSPWADEARPRISELQAETETAAWSRARPQIEAAAEGDRQTEVDALVARFPQPSRLYVEDVLLPIWAASVETDRSTVAARTLRLAAAIAKALERHSGDSLLITIIENADENSRPARARGTIAITSEGIRYYQAAKEDFRAERFEDAALAFNRARALLERVGSPLGLWAHVFEAASLYNSNRPRAALDTLIEIRRTQGERLRFYSALKGRIAWLSGIAHLTLGYPADSVAELREGRELFDRLGERENLAAVQSLLAESLERIGDTDRAWVERSAALHTLAGAGNVARTEKILDEAGWAALRDDAPALAGLIYARILRTAIASGQPRAEADALFHIGICHFRTGSEDLGLAEIRRARERAAAILDSSVRLKALAFFDQAEARLLRDRDRTRATQLLDQAEAFFTSMGRPIPIAEISLEKGRLLRAEGRLEEAAAELERGVRSLEQISDRVRDDTSRATFFESARALLDELVPLLVDMGRPEDALEWADRGRARALLTRLHSDSLVGYSADRPSSEPLNHVTRALPRVISESTAVLEYFCAPRRLFVWLTARSGSAFTELPFGRDAIASEVELFLSALEGRKSESDMLVASERLFDLLIRDHRDALAGLSHVIIVPDGPLSALPFAALRDRRNARWVLEDFAVSSSPSAAFLLNDAGVAPEPRSSKRVALAVGDPAFDRSRYPHLPRLPGSDAEVRAIRSFLPGSRLLLGRSATKESLLELAPGFDVLHLSTHGLWNRYDPFASALILAESARGGGDSALRADEIAQLRLVRRPVVVLAACHSARGATLLAEGAFGVARAFLVAGASAVLATSTQISDASSRALFRVFYDRLSQGRSPRDALRDAQLSLARSEPAHPLGMSRWASFSIVEGRTTN